MNFSPANITALVVAASFAAGLNIYATVLTLGILARTQWVALPPGLARRESAKNSRGFPMLLVGSAHRCHPA